MIITINYSLNKILLRMDWLLFLGIGIVVGILVGVAATLYMVADKDDDDDCGDCCDCGDGGYCDEC